VAGSFTGSATFGETTLTSLGESDAFIARYNAAGSLLWVKQAGSSGIDEGRAIAIDKNGESYMTGTFSGNAVFGTTILAASAADDKDAFIARYNSEGALVWVRAVAGALPASGDGIGLDEQGNCYVTGTFTGTARWGDTQLTSTFNDPQIYLAKYNNAGTLIWVKHVESGLANDLAVGATGDSYLTGHFLSSGIFSGAYVIRYDQSGHRAWTQGIPAGGGGFGHGVALDQSGNILVIGYATFRDGSIFGGTTLSASGGFIAKYDWLGNLLWAQKSGSIGQGVAVDAAGDIYATGLIAGSADFGGQELKSRPGEQEIFMAKYDAQGKVLWAYQPGGVFSSSGNGVAVDENGNGYFTGVYYGTLTLGAHRTTGDADMFLTKFGHPPQIIIPLQSQRPILGGRATFSVTANGSLPLNFQWQLNGSVVLGANGPILTISNVQNTDLGAYAVIVSNEAGSVTSEPAFLTAAARPAFLPQSLIWTANGISISLQGEVGISYLIQSSGDLMTWTDLMTVTDLSVPILLEAGPSILNQRFYRALANQP